MTSFKQIEANRRNASKSTGPTTEEGKQRSRCNAIRHGLTAETVIRALEDAEDYKSFEGAITADYDAESAVERELVLRLASLLWRLRRATTIETCLFEIQADHLRELRNDRHRPFGSRQIIHDLSVRPAARPDHVSLVSPPSGEPATSQPHETRSAGLTADPPVDLARCFLGLANLPNFTLDRLGRYEAALWRQVGQTLFALEALDRRKPQERGRRLHIRSINHLRPDAERK
jgi:hypothetical protein